MTHFRFPSPERIPATPLSHKNYRVDEAHDPEADDNSSLFLPQYPVELFLPEHFEPRYAYPLILWFHDHGENEAELLSFLPAISERNYLGLGFRGTEPLTDDTFGWSHTLEDVQEFHLKVQQTVSHLQEHCQIHPDRIYLAGTGSGAGLALQLLLDQPHNYQGMISLNGRLQAQHHSLMHYRQLKDKRVFLSSAVTGEELHTDDPAGSGLMLHTAGLSVTTRIYKSTSRLPQKMFTTINEWIMGAVATAWIH